MEGGVIQVEVEVESNSYFR